MTNAKFDAVFGGPPRKEGEPLEQKHMDLAASVQAATEEIVLRLTRTLAKEYGIKNPVPGRGRGAELCRQRQSACAMVRLKMFWVQPAAGDAGGALGAALNAYYLYKEQPRTVERGDGCDEGLVPWARVCTRRY